MKKLYLLLLFVFMQLNASIAQELSVKAFVLAPTDITAQTEGRKDLNGDACALVKISFVGDVADVEGNVIKPLVKRNNETWAFMTQESRQMKVVTKDYLPLMVTFGDYGIEKLQGNRTYVLTLAKPSGASEILQMQTLTIKYSPMSAMVLVDVRCPNQPVILGSPAALYVPAVAAPCTTLLIKFGRAKVVLPSPAPYIVPMALNNFV